ncbi:hypothetical protein CK203_064326 [Vitis vinifera]|uniref:Uncharacterized protein n=1 Tax=Vitis vinifera TaxID=29760 RepID=A0A438G506_VITVI|nr:hypothetical protein CK203_064326 [Vitis vinifera]
MFLNSQLHALIFLSDVHQFR